MRTKKRQSMTNLLSARVDPDMRAAMLRWAEQRKLPLSWVVNRVVEIGWPIFLNQSYGIAKEEKGL